MSTPIITIEGIHFKREDLNTTGSAKDRAIIAQLQKLKTAGYASAVISSTGNAAISADHYCHGQGIALTVFVSPKADPSKKKLIKNSQIIISSTPISDAFKYAKEHHCYNLRQSLDDAAILGYSEIGREIDRQLPEVTSVFVPVGSGTTLLGIASGLNQLRPIYAVQPSANPTITKFFDPLDCSESTAITDALTVKSLPQKSKIISSIKQSQGSGLTITNQQILEAETWLKANQVNTSLEGALALAGLFKAKQLNLNVGSNPLIILTGTTRHG